MPLANLPLATQSYRLDARGAAGQRLLNMQAEQLPEGARSPFLLRPTPGLARVMEVGFGPIRELASLPGILYIASGQAFYRYKNDGTGLQLLGNIGPNADNVTIAIGARQVVVCNPPRAFYASHHGELIEMTPGDNGFPDTGASSVSWIDGYFAFTNAEGTFFFVSKQLDEATFDALDFASSERRPDIVRRCIAHNGELWLFGMAATAVWYDSGAADFPFRERAGSVQDRGLGAMRSLAVLDRSLIFLGNDRTVYQTAGYQLQRISDFALEETLGRYPTSLDEITGCAWMWQGHACYALRLPALGATYVYDMATRVWHERSSGADGVGPWRAHRAVPFPGAVPFSGGIAFGSATDGVLFSMDREFAADDGVTLQREVVLPPLVQHGARGFMGRLEVEMEVATGEPVTLDWSDDGGSTWGPARTLGTGGPGETRKRVYTTRLGSFRQRLLRFRGAGRLAIYAVDADVQAGMH